MVIHQNVKLFWAATVFSDNHATMMMMILYTTTEENYVRPVLDKRNGHKKNQPV